jgi:hypothetical protein
MAERTGDVPPRDGRLEGKRTPQMLSLAWTVVIARLFLLAPLVIVYDLGSTFQAQAQTAKPKASATASAMQTPMIGTSIEQLPAAVREMCEAILSAIHSGQIEDLRVAYEMNELKPAIADEAVADPIVYWRQVSGDGEGREILAALAEILDAGYAILPLGPDLENNKIYVWPYFAEIPLDRLSPGQEVELLRLVPPAVAKEMKVKGKYTHWRLAIGADGVWHSFKKIP